MRKHRSFALSDFSLRDVPGAIVVYVMLSAICVLAGLTLESVPPFWRGLLSGVGLGLCSALILLTLLHRRPKIDTTELPEPSAEVRRICEDPNSTLAKAVKAYRDETGLGRGHGSSESVPYQTEQPSRATMKRNPVFPPVFLTAGCTALFFAIFQANELAGQNNVEAKPRLTISRETTFFTEPIRADGSIDFVAAINNEFGKGVKPEENACTYLHRAFGPIKELPPSFYAKLGIEMPPAEGQYLPPFPLPLAIAELPAERLEKVLDHAEAAIARPWTRQECPELGAWLDAHRDPLELVHSAAGCQKFYSPLSDEFINVEQTKGPVPLLAVLLPGASKMRMAGRMLCSRAMLQLGEGDAEGAWADLIACRRLGRLASGGPTLVETMVGYSIENMSSRGILTLLEQTRPSSATVKQYRSDLEKLPPIRSVSDIVNVSERCTYIDAMLTIATGQSDAMALLAVEPGMGEAGQIFWRVPIRPFDWDEALRTGNAYYDRLVKGMRLPTHTLRRAAMEKLNSELKERATLRNFDPRGKRDIETAQTFAAVIAAIMLPPAARVRESEDVLRQTASNIDVAIALCEFRNNQDQYPEQLEELVPKYLGKMPVDQFTGATPIYRRIEAGCLLYSVGPNMKDEDGRKDGKADDIAVTL